MGSRIFLWGSGLPDFAKETNPELLASDGIFDLSELAPWFGFSLISEGAKSKCWLSGKIWSGPPLIIVGECSSSFDLAWYFHKLGLFPEWASVLVKGQWSGKGQLGRDWYSPHGNLYVTWHLPFPQKPWSEMLPLVTGYAVIQALLNLNIKVELKWPNDLVIDRKKVGGILIEEKNGAVMAGLGINLTTSPAKAQLRDPYALDATSLKEAGFTFTPVKLWLDLVKINRICYNEIVFLNNPGQFIAKLSSHLAFKGEKVRIDEHHGTDLCRGRIMGLDQHGGLIIKTSGECKVIRSGSIYPDPEFK